MKQEKRALHVNKVQYDNCKVLDKSGALGFICDYKKARWYLNEGYADKISDNPLVVRLNSKIESNDEHNDLCKTLKCLYEHESYQHERKNICAVCGKVKDFARF